MNDLYVSLQVLNNSPAGGNKSTSGTSLLNPNASSTPSHLPSSLNPSLAHGAATSSPPVNVSNPGMLKVLSAKAYLQSVWAQFDRPLFSQNQVRSPSSKLSSSSSYAYTTVLNFLIHTTLLATPSTTERLAARRGSGEGRVSARS